MKPAERTIDLVQRQIAIATKNNQPRVLAKLQLELSQMEANRKPKVVSTPAKRIDTKMYDNAAAIAFYADKRFSL